jgi:ATP-dependent Lon protease
VRANDFRHGLSPVVPENSIRRDSRGEAESAEFRNTQFSYSMGDDGVEKFVATPELYSESSIGGDPLAPGQVWVISSGGSGENPGLYKVDITEGPGSGVKILNQPTPPPFRESVRCAEQNLYVRAKELVGDRDPRQHEFSIQLRAFDSAKTGSAVDYDSRSRRCGGWTEAGTRA